MNEIKVTGNSQYLNNKIGTLGHKYNTGTNFDYGYIEPIHTYYYKWCYPCYNTVYEESKVDKAFKILKKLMDKKEIDGRMSVKRFIKLVHSITEEL